MLKREPCNRWIKNKGLLCIVCVFLIHIFFRFYNIEKLAVFGWDQVDNAWAFRFADKLGKIPESNSSPSRSVVIYSLNGIDSAHNKICITGANDSFYVGDGLYSFSSQNY